MARYQTAVDLMLIRDLNRRRVLCSRALLFDGNDAAGGPAAAGRQECCEPNKDCRAGDPRRRGWFHGTTRRYENDQIGRASRRDLVAHGRRDDRVSRLSDPACRALLHDLSRRGAENPPAFNPGRGTADFVVYEQKLSDAEYKQRACGRCIETARQCSYREPLASCAALSSCLQTTGLPLAACADRFR